MPKLRSIVLLALFLHSTSGHIVTNPSSHYSDVIKIKCESLPCRSVYFDRMCYFVIDSDGDISNASKKCSTMLTGAQFAKPSKASDEIWSSLLVEKSAFLSDGDVKGKTKAMCMLENEFPTSTGGHTSNAPKRTIRKGEKLVARWTMPVRVKFPEPLEVGQTIIVKGVFSPTEPRISFNLEKNDHEQIAIHFVIDFNQAHYGISASHWWGQWEGATKENPIKPNPFWRGGPFDIRFHIQKDQFQILINEELWDTYKFRIPLSTVTHFWAFGNGGYITYLQLGERYNPIPYSATLTNSTVDTTTSVEEVTRRAAMPFAWKFPEPLEVGQTIVFKGKFHESEARSSFNLMYGDQEQIAIHLVFDFNQDHYAISTSHWKGQWDGIRAENPIKTSPFKRGDVYDIRFRVQEDHFQVFINEKETDTYKFRIPLTTINHVLVAGLGYVNFVQLGEKYTPVLLYQPDHTFANEFPVCGKDSCSAKRETDVKRDIPTDCKTLIITGYFMTYTLSTYSREAGPASYFFDIKRKNGEIALRINPRFDQNLVVLNALWQNNVWQTEEKINNFPFKRDTKFQIAVTNEAYGFQIFVDGKYLATFKHRTCPFDIALIEAGPHVYDLGIQL